MSPNNEQYDVCVVGGGPAGSTAATFIAMRGHRVLLVEKESQPAYKIGESLLPSTVHGICSMLGVTEELQNQNFVRKLGGTFRWGKSKEPWSFEFAGSSRFQGPMSYAYQVERIKFDAILLNNAKRKGVEVLEQHRVADLIVDDDRVAGVKLMDNAGTEKLVRSKYVIDASGHTSTIARHAGERIFSKFFRNIAVFGYFRNAGRLPAPNSGNIFCAAFDKGWFWYIPLSDTLTSVGAVIGQEFSSLLHQGYEPALLQLIGSCEPIRKLLSGATRCSDAPYNEIRVRKDYSYCNTRFWKPGLVLIGDAACFVDPVFSSGVHLATYSALLAARSINASLEKHLDEAVAFAEFEACYKREYMYFYDFLSAFYELSQGVEDYFGAARKVLNAEERSDHAFLNLVGGDASGELMHDLQGSPASRIRQAMLLFPGAAGVSAEMSGENGNHTGEGAPFWGELIAEGAEPQLRGGTSEF
ncbi:MAG: tryptophan 7-halogenase [Acidobacteriia bacterium]|nr:tryptophan 7-halogenase [Terriglobia bacterium]